MLRLRQLVHRFRYAALALALAAALAIGFWTLHIRATVAAETATRYNFTTQSRLVPLGTGS
jgi:hypothetical protein